MQKPIVYGPIPVFDQCTQAVFQTEPVEMEDRIEIGVEVRDIEIVEGGGHGE